MCFIPGIHYFVILLLHESAIFGRMTGPRSAPDHLLQPNMRIEFIGKNPSIDDATEALPSTTIGIHT
jgi:hypothetical protein